MRLRRQYIVPTRAYNDTLDMVEEEGQMIEYVREHRSVPLMKALNELSKVGTREENRDAWKKLYRLAKRLDRQRILVLHGNTLIYPIPHEKIREYTGRTGQEAA